MELAQWAIDETIKNGADQASVSLNNRREVEIEYRDKKLEKIKESTQNSLSLDIYYDHKYSSHSTNDLRKETLDRFISEAVAATKYLSKDEFRELPDPKYYPKKMDKDLKLVDAEYSKVKSDERVKIAQAIEEVAMAQSDLIISATTGYSDVYSESVQVNSNGFSGETKGTMFYCGAEVTVRDGETGRPSDWYWCANRFKSEMPDAEFLGKEAARRALRKIGQKKIDSGKYTMLVENRSGGRLLGMFRGPMSARALQQKSSYLEGMLGKKIASEKLTVIDDPFVEKGLGSRFFDGDGIAAQKRTIIEKGVLKYYYIDNYYGRKLGMEPTNNGPANILFEYGTRNLDEIVKDVQKGILVTGFIGGNSNSTTGDFSFGIVGLLVENGKIVQAVNEMNISGNAKDFWNNLSEVGNDPYAYSSWKIPTLAFEDINFSGI